MDLKRLLERIDLVTRPWSGSGGQGLRYFNEDAPGQPVFWLFNTAEEMPALLGRMPKDRPFAAMRSLNQVVSETDRQSEDLLDLISSHYAAALIKTFGMRACVLGGNCQAGTIAWRIAEKLLVAGVALRQFVTLDAPCYLPLPVPVRMIFGSNSTHNLIANLRPNRLDHLRRYWDHAFPACELVEIPGTHGGYFLPETVGGLAEAILRPPPVVAPTAVPAVQQWQGRTGRGGVPVLIPAPDIAQEDGYLLIQLRRQPGGGLMAGQAMARAAEYPLPSRTRLEFRLRRLKARQEARPLEQPALIPVLCRRGVGPLGWPLAQQPQFAPSEPHPDLTLPEQRP